LFVPLTAGGKIFGILSFLAAESGRRYGATDLLVAEDLARRAGTAIENAQLYGAIREADRRKDEFIAVLAHELRNPLAPIRNSIQAMKFWRLDDPQIQWARDVVQRQVDQ